MIQTDDRFAEAVAHFLKLREPDVSVDDIGAALAWQDEAPANRAAFERVERTWHLVEHDRGPAVARLAGKARRPALPRWLSLNWGVRAAAAVLLTAIIAVSVGYWLQPQATPVQHFATAVGETRTVPLPDGSQVTLGGASAIAVTYEAGRRHLELTGGQALFLVARDTARPFVVEAGGGTTRAVGTVFDVHRGPHEVTVTVIEGSVGVDADATDGSPAVRLAAGTQVTYSSGGLSAVRPADAGAAIGWRTGTLHFVNQPLDAIVADLNRYSAKPIRLADAALGQVRLTGAVAVSGIDRWLSALDRVSAARALATTGGWTIDHRPAEGPALRAGAR